MSSVEALDWDPFAEVSNPRETQADLRKRGYLGRGARLPVDSLLASTLFGSWIDAGVVKPRTLLQIHEESLRERCEQGDDADAFGVLVALYSMTDHEGLHELERFGWDRYQDLNSFKAMVFRERTLSATHPYLASAEDVGLHDPELMQLIAQRVDDPETRIVWISRAARAEFADLFSWHQVQGPLGALSETLKERDR